MLTVKLMKGHTQKIVEAVEVNVYSAGAPESESTNKTNKVREVVVELHGGKTATYYVSDELHPLGFPNDIPIWDCAYIENAHGATTERVTAY